MEDIFAACGALSNYERGKSEGRNRHTHISAATIELEADLDSSITSKKQARGLNRRLDEAASIEAPPPPPPLPTTLHRTMSRIER